MMKLLLIVVLVGIVVMSGCCCCCSPWGGGGGDYGSYSSKKSYGESCSFDWDCASDDCSYGYCG